MQDNRIIDVLRSSNAILAVLVLALIAQTPHAADVFRIIGHSSTLLAYFHSYSFAIALELAVLVFVIQNRQIESYGFAGVSIAMNLSYYFLTGNTLIAIEALPDWLVSIALPVAIARYSHVVVEAHPEQSKPKQYRRTTVQVTRTDEQSEPSVVVVQPAQIEQQPTLDLTVLSKEDKRQYVFNLVRSGEQFVKSRLAGSLSISRTTLDNWISEVQS